MNRIDTFFGSAALVAAAVVMSANSAFAAMLDLAGVDKTVTDVAELSAYDGLANSSETQATLTFNLADGEVQTYGGFISGNIRLVKDGGKSRLTLTAANAYTGGTLIKKGILVAANALACGDVAKSVEIESRVTVADGTHPELGPWCTLQIDVSGFANPIILPAGTDHPRWIGNTFIDHCLCVTNGGISIDSPISGGRFTFMATKQYSPNSDGLIIAGDVTFNGPITCTGISIYAGTSGNNSIHFRGAVTNSIGNITGGTWRFFPTLRFYSPQNQFNGTSFTGAYRYLRAEADNVFNGLDSIASDTSERGRLYLQGHDVTIGRVRCASATSDPAHENQTIYGGTGAGKMSMLRMRGGEDTVSNFRFVENLSLEWDPTGNYTFTATSNRTSTLTGQVIVRRGTFSLEGGHTMGSLSGVKVFSGATFRVSADSSINAAAVVRAESGATLDIAGDVSVAGLKVGTTCLSAGDYAAGTHSGLTIVGAGTLHVTAQLGEEWETTQGVIYPYVYPLYIADVATSNSIDEVEFSMIETPGAAESPMRYETFSGSAHTGTIVKRGDGTLTFDRNISTFTGPVHVEDGVAIGVCSNCFGSAPYAGQSDNQRIYVHSGATLVMDAIGNKPVTAEYNAIYYEGDGYPGMGGAYVFRNGEAADGESYWQAGVSSRAVGTTRIYVDFPAGGTARLNWGPASDFSLNGQDVLMYGRTVDSCFGANPHPIKDIGNLVISNMTMEVGGSSGALLAKNGSVSTIRFCGGSRWFWNSTSDWPGQTATTFIDDMEYMDLRNWLGSGTKFLRGGIEPWGADGATKLNWYYGPMVLNDDFRMSNYYSPRTRGEYSWSLGCTFSAKVSGPKGFRPWFNPAKNKLCGDAMRLNLLNNKNDFEGGIVLDNSSLGVYGATAVPSQDGAGIVSITNGYVYFGRVVESAAFTNAWVNFTMPVTEFVNGGAVTNGTGAFKGLVKKGTGTLDYNSQMGGDCLDLQSGTVKFNTQYREAYTGDNAGAAPGGYAAALPVFTTLKGTAGSLDLSGVGGSWTVANIEGSPSVTNGNLTVTGNWTVDAAAVGAATVKVSGTLTFGADATMSVVGDLNAIRPRPRGGFLVAKAASIVGQPRMINGGGWVLVVVGGELRIAKPGFTISIR